MNDLKVKLKETLATVFSFYLKTHMFHWNVEGPEFYQLHKMFEQIYEDVYDSIDPLAEQIRAIGSYAPGSLKRYVELSKIQDEVSLSTPAAMVTKLIADNKIVIETLNAAFMEAEKQKQQGLMNFLADRIDKHHKWEWFLTASNK